MNKIVLLTLSAAMVGGAALATVSSAETSGVISSGRVMAPGKGISFDIGHKHAVSYFVKSGDSCQLTLVIADARDEQIGNDSPGTRLVSSVLPGTAARIDVADGQSVEFACATGAENMSVSARERLSYPRRT